MTNFSSELWQKVGSPESTPLRPDQIRELTPEEGGPWQPRVDWVCFGLGQRGDRRAEFQSVRSYLEQIAGEPTRFSVDFVSRAIKEGGLRAYWNGRSLVLAKLDIVDWLWRGCPKTDSRSGDEMATWVRYRKGINRKEAETYVREAIVALGLEPDRRPSGWFPPSLRGKVGRTETYSLGELKERIVKANTFSDYVKSVRSPRVGALLLNCTATHVHCSLVPLLAHGQPPIDDPFLRAMSAEEYEREIPNFGVLDLPVHIYGRTDDGFVLQT